MLAKISSQVQFPGSFHRWAISASPHSFWKACWKLLATVYPYSAPWTWTQSCIPVSCCKRVPARRSWCTLAFTFWFPIQLLQLSPRPLFLISYPNHRGISIGAASISRENCSRSWHIIRWAFPKYVPPQSSWWIRRLRGLLRSIQRIVRRLHRFPVSALAFLFSVAWVWPEGNIGRRFEEWTRAGIAELFASS